MSLTLDIRIWLFIKYWDEDQSTYCFQIWEHNLLYILPSSSINQTIYWNHPSIRTYKSIRPFVDENMRTFNLFVYFFPSLIRKCFLYFLKEFGRIWIVESSTHAKTRSWSRTRIYALALLTANARVEKTEWSVLKRTPSLKIILWCFFL